LYSPPGISTLGLNFQPSAFAHHAFVAPGSLLANSVCVIDPYTGFDAAFFAEGRSVFLRAGVFFRATFFRAAFFGRFFGVAFRDFFLLAIDVPMGGGPNHRHPARQ
jgi:hypothetical protein